MPITPSMDQAAGAVLVMDYQTHIVNAFSPDPAALLRVAGQVLTAARAAGMPVIYVRMAFREGYPELSPANQAFAPVRQAGWFVEGNPGTEIHPAVAPRPGEVTVVKRRVSAFAGSDLGEVLRAGGINTLVLLGVATSGVVLATALEAADRDYRLVFVKDGCSDPGGEVHEFLFGNVFPRVGQVMHAPEAIAWMQTGPHPYSRGRQRTAPPKA